MKGVILAGGLGTRLGGDRPKQFQMLKETSLLSRTVDRLISGGQIGHVVVAAPAGWEDETRASLAGAASRLESLTVVTGGDTRQKSVTAALNAAPEGTTHVVVHDAARPFVRPEWIGESLALCTVPPRSRNSVSAV